MVANPIFWAIGHHLESFSEASDQPEGQELGGGAEEVKKDFKM